MEKGPRTEPSGSNLTSSDTDDASRTPTNHTQCHHISSASQPEMKLLKDEIIGERREEGEEVRVVVGGGGGLATSLSSAMAIAGAEQRAAGDGGASPPFGLGLPRREITATTISCELLWTPGKPGGNGRHGDVNRATWNKASGNVPAFSARPTSEELAQIWPHELEPSTRRWGAIRAPHVYFPYGHTILRRSRHAEESERSFICGRWMASRVRRWQGRIGSCPDEVAPHGDAVPASMFAKVARRKKLEAAGGKSASAPIRRGTHVANHVALRVSLIGKSFSFSFSPPFPVHRVGSGPA
ncbi:hypothetical protein B296_00006682 [Ensete ventricosum]|uniref:Uncharacterized protein n=1 Tax=Ensete ventricosum TaxID=4639 RepID=A0A426ZAZ4_ENSVE|nr:hypothetical protein B296_00006682 [Ensete ventricosum]